MVDRVDLRRLQIAHLYEAHPVEAPGDGDNKILAQMSDQEFVGGHLQTLSRMGTLRAGVSSEQ